MDKLILEKAQHWAKDPAFDPQFRAEISGLIDQNNEAELTDRFYKDLEFGTGGLRGIIGAGSNRINSYTVRRATQGMATYIKKAQIPNPSVAIACDSRNFSDTFAQEAALVLAANQIKVFLYDSLRPTPMLSFAVRHLGATAGIVITASHNPKEYNGYKVSWSDGCQVTPPHDQGIIDEVNGIQDFGSIKTMDFEAAKAQGLIQIIGDEIDQPYYALVKGLSLGERKNHTNFGVVYTPLHGAGNLPVRHMLAEAGFEQVTVVASQELPDGDFPTVASPNPEEASALEEAQKAAGPNDQLIMATDPDSDRIGGMARDKAGQWAKLNGNQIGQLLLDFYLTRLEQKDELPAQGHMITTIVTSTLAKKIAEDKGLLVDEVLTGFKYIGEKMAQLDSTAGHQFVFGTEESHGYLFGDFVRDKDAVSAAMIFAEMAATMAAQGKTLFDRLEEIHVQYGYHSDELVNRTFKGKEGAEKILRIMQSLRQQPPAQIAGVQVSTIRDYQSSEITTTGSGAKESIDLPKSNVLAFLLADGSRITARPSGTEPKIKFYFNLTGENPTELKAQQERYIQEFVALIETI